MQANLTQNEWHVMACLWEAAPQTSMQLVARLRESHGWAKSTTLTTLSRMEAKGLIRAQVEGRSTAYYPLVDQNDATKNETSQFLGRVYQGSIGLMVNAMMESQQLSQEEIRELISILQSGGAKKQ